MTEEDPVIQKTASWLRSHQVRLSFEQLGGGVIVFVVIFCCLIGFWSDDMTKRVVALRDAIKDFLGVLGLTIGASWTRGAVDHGVEKIGGDK